MKVVTRTWQQEGNDKHIMFKKSQQVYLDIKFSVTSLIKRIFKKEYMVCVYVHVRAYVNVVVFLVVEWRVFFSFIKHSLLP